MIVVPAAVRSRKPRRRVYGLLSLALLWLAVAVLYVTLSGPDRGPHCYPLDIGMNGVPWIVQVSDTTPDGLCPGHGPDVET